MLQGSVSDPGLAEELPYWEFIEGPRPHVILKDGSLVSGVELSLLDIECFDENEVNQFVLGLRSALNSLSEGLTVQFHFTVGSDYSEIIKAHKEGQVIDAHALIKDMAQLREENLEKALSAKELYRPSLTVYLRSPMIQAKKLSFFKRREDFSVEAANCYEESLEVLTQNMDSFISGMAGLGLKAKVLQGREHISKVYSFLNPKRAGFLPAPEIKSYSEQDNDTGSDWLSSSSPREQLAFGDLVLGMDQFTLDSHYHKVITLKTLPEVTFAGQLSNFLRMPFHYDLLLTFEIPPQAAEMAKLQQKRKMAHSLAITQGNRASDLESETKLTSAEELIRELLSTGQRIYATQLALVLKAPVGPDGQKKLNQEVREVLSRFRSLQGAEGLEETVGAWKVLKGSLPAAPMYVERARKVKTNNLADFIPLFGPREGDPDPAVIFRNRLNGLVSFNPFDPCLPNYNALVTGSSGAGKSFLNNCILTQELARGLRVFIVDIGGSYKKLTQALDGQYLEINLHEAYRINPFALPDPKVEPSSQKLKSLLAIIESMVAEDEKSRLPKLDRVLLEKAIIELYKLKSAEGMVPTLSNLREALSLSSEPSMQALSKMLYMWTGDRPYGRLLDGDGSLDSKARICTFDLKGLSAHPDLQSVMILILTDFILTQVDEDKVNKKRIILDEAWELLKSSAAAGFMEYCARTLRKSGSGITFITQGVEEIVASPIGSAILNNTATKFVMLQRGDSEILAKNLKLNHQEIALINSLEQRKGEYSEGFLIEGDHRQVIRVFPTPFEYWLSTSDAGDNKFLNRCVEHGMGLVDAIREAVRIYPQGVSQGMRKQEEGI